jgi:hypothetical protein
MKYLGKHSYRLTGALWCLTALGSTSFGIRESEKPDNTNCPEVGGSDY